MVFNLNYFPNIQIFIKKILIRYIFLVVTKVMAIYEICKYICNTYKK